MLKKIIDKFNKESNNMSISREEIIGKVNEYKNNEYDKLAKFLKKI